MTGTQIKQAYIHTKMLYDRAVAELDRQTAHLPYDDPDRLDEIVDFEIQVREALNMQQIHNDLVAAEQALLAWARERVATDPATAAQFAARADDLDKVFTTCRPGIHRKVIDFSLRLEE